MEMLSKNTYRKPFQSLFIVLLLIVVTACSEEQSIAGAYVNENGIEIQIDCNHRFHTSETLQFPFLPKNGDEISLATSAINESELELWYEVDGMQSPFGVWNKAKNKITIMGETYTRKPNEDCNCDQGRLYSANVE